MNRVLIIDDEIEISELVALILKQDGILSTCINNPLEVFECLKKEKYDLILLDIMMPDISGIELCNKIREQVDYPILFLTAKNRLVDKMLGYEVGADDYITKPFVNEELLLKVKSYLRFNKRRNNKKSNLIQIGEIKLNKESYEVTKNAEKIELSTREFKLLKYLMENAGIVLSKEQIFKNVWDSDYGDIGTVAVNIKYLRDKLKDKDKYIMTIWGYGYKFIRDLNDEK